MRYIFFLLSLMAIIGLFSIAIFSGSFNIRDLMPSSANTQFGHNNSAVSVNGTGNPSAADFELTDQDELPIEIESFQHLDQHYFRITNLGRCEIESLKMTTIPPKPSLWQKLTGASSFRIVLGRLNINTYTEVSFRDLINSEGLRLSENYVVGAVKFKGDYCGTMQVKIKNWTAHCYKNWEPNCVHFKRQ